LPFNTYPFPEISSVMALPAEGCQPLEVNFQAVATNANTYEWEFGWNALSAITSTPNATFTYPDTGTFTVTLRAYSFGICGDTLVMPGNVLVHITPVASFRDSINLTQEPVDGTVFFFNQSLHADQWEWDFGDGTGSTDENPVHRYQDVSDFNIRLTASNQFGCSDDTVLSRFIFRRSLYVPNALAPDFGGGDTLVKIWKPVGIGLRQYRAQVFNTWGELIWESTRLENTKPTEFWDGTYQGKLCPQDVYVWKVYGVFLDGYVWEGMSYAPGEPKKTIGSITLVR
jgi:hypothetical protein